MKALLLIDIQNDFLPGGALAVTEGDRVIPLVNALQQHFELVIATQDWHPTDHKSFASQHEGKRIFEKIELNGLEQVLWPDHCIQGTLGAEFSLELNTDRIEVIFRKGTDPEIDSYSGFYDNGHLKSTGLSSYLVGKDVTDLYIAGLAGDFCVYFSAKDSLTEGFKTFLIEDATRSISPEGFEQAKLDILALGGKIIQSTDVDLT